MLKCCLKNVPCHYKNKFLKIRNYTYVLIDTFILVGFQLIYNTVLFIRVGDEPSPLCI